jgi:hypothetical protein
MKITGLILFAAMAWSSSSFAQAQQQAPATSAAEAPQSMQSVIVSAKRFHLEPQEFMNYESSKVGMASRCVTSGGTWRWNSCGITIGTCRQTLWVGSTSIQSRTSSL